MENRLPLPYPRRNENSTSKHYALGIIIRSNETDKEPFILVYPGRKGNSKKWILRLPGSRQRDGESYYATLNRACREKVGADFNCRKWKKGPMMLKTIGGREHFQVVFFGDVSDMNLSLRKDVTIIEPNDEIYREEWRPPEFVPLSEAVKKLFHSHRALLLASLQMIREQKPSFREYIDFSRVNIVKSKNVSFGWLKQFFHTPCFKG